MKKNLKKLFAIIMTVAVVLSMALPTMAADNQFTGSRTDVNVTNPTSEGNLTINGSGDYTAYKVFSAAVEDGDNTYTWTEVSGWTGVTIPPAETIATYDAVAMKELASKLAGASGKPNPITVKAGSQNKLEIGYYLIVDDGNEGLEKSQPILVAIPQVVGDEWVYNISVTPKSSHTNFEKKIKDAKTNELVDTNTANVGDFVTYYLSADIPIYEADAYTNLEKALKFKITDTMSEELTWVTSGADGNVSSVAVYVVNNKDGVSGAVENHVAEASVDTDYKLTVPATDEDGATFTVDFSEELGKKNKFLETYQGKVVVVVFKAKLNSSAVIGTDAAGKNNKIDGYDTLDGNGGPNYNGVGNPNGATLEYTNNYYGEEGVDTIDDTVTTFSFKLDIEKVDAADDQVKLDGATFKVYKTYNGAEDEDEGELYTNDIFTDGTLTTAEDTGLASAEGFAADTYYLKETEAPEGYKRFDGVITVQINEVGDTGAYNYTITMGADAVGGNPTVVQVKDEKGTTLPGTGGIGTTIFTFGGLALIVLAGILLVVYTRKQKKAKA